MIFGSVGTTWAQHRPKGSVQIYTEYRVPKALMLLAPQNTLRRVFYHAHKGKHELLKFFFLYTWIVIKNYFFHHENINFYMDTWFFCSCFCCARNSSLSFSTRSCLAILSIRWWFWTVSTYSKGISSSCYCQIKACHVTLTPTYHFLLVNNTPWRWQSSSRFQVLEGFGLVPREIPFQSGLFESLLRLNPCPA